MTILVTGATGRVGGDIIKGLLSAGVPARGLCRDPRRACLPAQAQVIPGDLTDPASMWPALQGVRSVFLYAQTEGLAGQMHAMSNAGIRQVVVLSTIDATNPHPYAQHNRARHCAVENAVADAGFDHTFLRPGAFASNAQRFWGAAIAVGNRVPMPFPQSQQAPVAERDIAAVAIRALTSRELGGQAIVLTGPQSLTQQQQLAILSAALGCPLEVQAETVDEARARLLATIPKAYVELLLAQWADEAGTMATVTDAIARISGRAATTFAQWCAEQAGSFPRTGMPASVR